MIDNAVVLANVKLIKGINDELQDDLLNVLIDESKARILAYINGKRAERLDDLPIDLAYVLQDVTVVRFNKLNAEGALQDSEEGRSFTWDNNYLAQHLGVLNSYHDISELDEPRRGAIYYY